MNFNQIILFTITVIALVEIVIMMNFPRDVYALHGTGKKIWWWANLKKVSDCWKEKSVQKYSQTLLIAGLRMTTKICIIAGLFLAACEISNSIESGSAEIWMQPMGIAASFILASLWLVLRKQIVRRLTHWHTR
ncbi:hypothetical protein [Insolitispirillum peregrinum]|uniref:hypothetical protein n=1 Tax=Insolitispirillum peregrinum TaxID=80876 RepID=UPI000970672E|nr:hypothetical protein [Insolitispirillum peregrinum]